MECILRYLNASTISTFWSSFSKMATCYQKHPFEIESEDRLTTINTKIFEVKKKIQLSEGQRKSNYEENEAEKEQNCDLIDTLKKEIKIRLEELTKARALVGEDEIQLKKFLGEVCPIGKKSIDQVIHNLDLKVIEQRKSLDLLKYEKNSKKNKLRKLEQDYEKLLIDHSKSATEKLKLRDPSKKQISHLENEIHKVLVQWTEAELVKKKYAAIRKSLIDDSVKFESSLSHVNELLKKQQQEIVKLEQVKEEATTMRLRATAALMTAAADVQNAEQTRAAERAFFAQRFEERKLELERLEKRIFPPVRAPARRDSSGSMVEEEEVEEVNVLTEMENVFQKLMKLTGANEAEQVFDRFRSQRETSKRLNYLQHNTEEEKLALEKTQTTLMSQLEAFKFASVQDKEEAHDKIFELKETIQIEAKDIVILEKKLIEINNSLLANKRLSYELCKLLETCPEPQMPEWTTEPRDIEQVLHVLTSRYDTACSRAEEIRARRGDVTPVLPSNPPSGATSGVGISSQTTPREVEPQAPSYKDLLEKEPVKAQAPSEEEEDIPSRSFLKRQAQLILDTKSRRKGFRPPYPRK